MAEKQARTKLGGPIRSSAVGGMTDRRSHLDDDVRLLQFKIPKNIKREFRQMAMDEDMTMTDLFLKMFEEYK